MTTTTATTQPKKKAPPKPAKPKPKGTPGGTSSKPTKPAKTTSTATTLPPADAASVDALLARYGIAPTSASGSGLTTASKFSGNTIVTKYAQGPPSKAGGFPVARKADAGDYFNRRMYQGTDEQYEALQHALFDAGFYTAPLKSIRFKDRTDAATEIAMGNAISALASLQGGGRAVTFDQMLKDASAFKSQDELAGDSPVFSPVLANRDDVKMALEEKLPTLIGRTLSDAEMEDVITTFLDASLNAQRKAFDASTAGGTTEAAPSLDVIAEQKAKQLAPDEYKARQLADKAKMFQAIIGQNSGETASF